MKISKFILLLALICGAPACTDLDIPPMNVVQDKDIFSSENGIKSYMARIYGQLPIEDFRYCPERRFNHFWIINPFPAITGEALSRDQTSARSEEGYWGDAYKLIRDINYFLETLPQYASNFSAEQVNTWTGEAYFVKGATYFALAKRYGGIPLVDNILKYPEQSIEELQVPRSSEETTYNKIAEDLDKAYSLLPETNQVGRANKYAAAGFKSRAMLFAGSIAKYNQVSLFDKSNNRLCGISADKAADYFKLSYDAAKLLEGHYSLYKDGWKANDKEAQYQNYIDLFFSAKSQENVFVRQYGYPESVHGYDVYNIPYQYMVGGYSSEVNPTLEFVEMFDGLPKKTDGKIDVYDSNGKYKMYDKQMDFFASAEPRLRATVIFPGDVFKDQTVEIWRGIYIGEVNGGISPLLSPGTKDRYENTSSKSLLVTSATPGTQVVRTLPNGTEMNAAGRSGCFYSHTAQALSGFSIRKWMNPAMPAAQVVENRSDQTWIELRYAEVLLNRAEAAYELYLAGKGDVDYQSDAYTCINQIRERAGADLLTNKVALNSIDIVRKERRKELGFENKIWWDLKRWRLLDKEQNATTYRILMPFYAEKSGKWFYDDRFDELNSVYNWDSRWYYQKISDGEITKSPNLVQNSGY